MVIQEVNTGQQRELGHLAGLPQPVSKLYYLGPLLELLVLPRVAIVGSRKVSDYGQGVTYKLASELARVGVVVISGLALGTDSIAHRAVVEAGRPTIAVLPAGLGKIYPASHTGLARKILSTGGALVSEYPVEQTGAQKYRFIARNRIIAALSQGVVIPEAAAKSGSLHTAEFALEQGLDVFAVPGNVTSSLSAGTNNLIKFGAHPTTSAEDILEILNIKSSSPIYRPANDIEEQVMDLLGENSLTTEQLFTATKLELSIINQTLTMLEINSAIKRSADNQWSVT